MECERCDGTGLDPETYIVQRGSDGKLVDYANAPCSECQPDGGERPANSEERPA